MNFKLRKTLLTILCILAIAFSAVMAISCQNNSDDLKSTETLTEIRQIPDYGMAMVTIGNTTKLVSGKITTDANGRSIITDEVTGETYDVIAAQMIEAVSFATATVKDLNGQDITVTGPVLSTSDDGTTVILDPNSGTQYIVKTSEVTPSTTKPTTVSEKTDPATSRTTATSGSSSATTGMIASTTEDSYELGEGDSISTDPALETAYNGSITTATTTTAANVAVPMARTFTNDVLAEINRYRTANGLSELTFTSDNTDMVQNYANDLALQKPNPVANFPKISKLVTSIDGTQAAKQLIGSGSSDILNSSIQYVAICAAQSSQTMDIFLVIAF